MRDAMMHPLRAARRRYNLTIEQLAGEVKIGAATVWRAEHNYPINAESRRRLCAYFSMTSQELGLVHDGQVQESAPASNSIPEPEAPPAQPVLNTVIPQSVPASLSNVFSQKKEAPDEQPNEQHISAWLALTGCDLSSLFDADWTLDAVLDSLRVVLQSIQGMPREVRQMVLRQGMGTMIDKVVPPSKAQFSAEERMRFCESLQRSVDDGWKLFHVSRPAHVLVVAQTQLYLLKQTHALVPLKVRDSLYAAIYNLIGAAFFFQGNYATARQAYEKAHIAALEGADVWNMAQSLNWQAIVATACGHYEDAIQSIRAALRLLVHQEGVDFVRLRAHLLGDWAYNASIVREHKSMQDKLASSAALVEQLGPHEEFDLARWHQIAGSCMLISGNYSSAIDHLQTSLDQVEKNWIARRVLTMLPLAEAYARQRERDTSIEVAERLLSLLHTADSTMLNQRFMEYQQTLTNVFPQDRRVSAFIASNQQRVILKP